MHSHPVVGPSCSLAGGMQLLGCVPWSLLSCQQGHDAGSSSGLPPVLTQMLMAGVAASGVLQWSRSMHNSSPPSFALPGCWGGARWGPAEGMELLVVCKPWRVAL
jgi:hypothetical protein